MRIIYNFKIAQLIFWLVFVASANAANVSLKKISSGNRYQAITFDNKGNVWISGTNASVAVSSDDGENWTLIPAPGVDDKLQFRDIDFANDAIIVMAAGEAQMSKIFRLPLSQSIASYTDINQDDFLLEMSGLDAATFYDCVTISDGIEWLYGDSSNKELFVLRKTRTEHTWQNIRLPFSAQDNEGGFAASGTCAVSNRDLIVIGTGNSRLPRLLLKDKGEPWQSVRSPFSGGSAAGIFSLIIDEHKIFAFGGSLRKEDKGKPAQGFIYNRNTNSWQVLPELPLKGAVYGSAIRGNFVYISNPSGVAKLDLSKRQWEKFSDVDIWALNCQGNLCFGVGSNDTVMKF